MIRDGARLIGSIEDLLEDLPAEIFQKKSFSGPKKSNTGIITDKNQLLIINTLQETGKPLNVDKIIELTKLEPPVVNQAIAFLTIAEIIKETEKGYLI